MALTLYSTTTDHANGSSRTVAADMGSGADRLCVVKVSCTWETITGVTVGGVAATEQVSRLYSGFHSYIFTYVAPATGSQNVVVTFSAACNSVITVVVYNGADQTAPVRGTGYAEGTGTAPSLVITSSSTDVVVDALAWNGDSATATAVAGTGQTDEHNYRYPAAYCAGGHSYEAGASSVTMSWTLSASRDYSLVAVSLIGTTSVTENLIGAVTAAASQVSALKNTRRMGVAPSGASTVAGSPSLYRAVLGAVTSSAAMSQSLRIDRKVSGGVAGASSGTRSIWVARKISGTAPGTSGGSLVMSLYRRIAGAVPAASFLASTFMVLRKLQGAASSVLSLGSAMMVYRSLSASVSAVAAFTAVMGQKITLIVSVAAQSTLSGTAHLYRRLVGAVTSLSGLVSSMPLPRTLAGVVLGVASLGASLTSVLVQNVVALIGESMSHSGVSVMLGLRRALGGAVHSIVTMVNTLTSRVRGMGQVNGRQIRKVSLTGAASGRSISMHGKRVSLSGKARMVRIWR